MNGNSSIKNIFLAIGIGGAFIGVLFSTFIVNTLNRKAAEAKELARPADIDITIISAPECKDCFNVNNAVGDLKKQNVRIRGEKTLAYDSAEGQNLIQRFGIKKVPSYLFSGEVGKENIKGFIKSNGEVKDSTFIFTKITPVYIETSGNKEAGRVKVTYLLDPACSQCIKVKDTVGAFKQAGVKIFEEKELSWNSLAGQKLIQKYTIEKIPTFIFSSDIAVYESVLESWPNIGTVETDASYVARQIPLPYRQVNKGIVGLVDVIYLSDSSCADCYKPEEIHREVLTRGFGVGIRSEKSINYSSPYGNSLVKKYQITKVPTLLISPEVSEYTSLKSVWQKVGTIEKDGWYIFRQMDQLGKVIYKDLSTNGIIRP